MITGLFAQLRFLLAFGKMGVLVGEVGDVLLEMFTYQFPSCLAELLSLLAVIPVLSGFLQIGNIFLAVFTYP